jgi:hypothetical protein
MNHSSSVGDPNASKPIAPSLSTADTAGISGSDLQGAMQTPVSSTGDLKAMLIAKLGEEEGLKLYNGFMKSFVMLMLQQIQESAAHAKAASQRARYGG